MFKKSVITDEISQDFKMAADLAVKYGLDAVEIRSVWDKSPHELSDDDISLIKEILEAEKLKVSAISAPVFKCDIDSDEEYALHIEILKKSIQLAMALDTKYIRGFTFWNKGDFFDRIDEIAGKIKLAEELLKEKDVILVLEPDPSVYATNAKKLALVLEKINSSYIKALWDPGNDIYDPDGEIPYPDGYNLIKKHMVHFHLKDAVVNENGTIESVAIGEGAVDYKGQFKALIEDGYEGYAVLETHYRPKHAILEELMKLPKGSEFSYLAHIATEECLVKWDSMLKELFI